jgi:ABC-type phosphate transport system substrate-binding protein
VAVALSFAGCGRSLPADTPPAPGGGDATGAFGEVEALAGSVRVAGWPRATRFVEVAARGFRAEEPEVTVRTEPRAVADALDALCAGTVAVAVTDRPLRAAEASACEADARGAVELAVARSGSAPIYLVTTIEALAASFETESLLSYVVDNSRELAAAAGLEPLSLDRVERSRSAFDDALAGLG